MTREKITRKNVPHFLIFDYWKDKVILSNGEIVEGRNKPDKDYDWVVGDNYEPCCWGCGLPAISELEKNHQPISDDDLPLIWNDREVKHKLNRCHIKPRSLGGEDAPDNLFLMCDRFHEESPDTTNSHTFFRWVCISTSPGVTSLPPASITSAFSRSTLSPMPTILPFATDKSPFI